MTMRTWLRTLFARPTTRTNRKAPHRFRPALETLEDRTVPSTLTTLASFEGTNGAGPGWGLIRDSQGNIFGTTGSGGASNFGTVFKVAAGTNTITTLASFNGSDGAFPLQDLVLDSQGNLFGTTYKGGQSFGSGFDGNGYGTVFELAAGSNTITTLASFDRSSNGSYPLSGLVLDGSGNLFGTTSGGGFRGGLNEGTVFEVVAGSNTITTIATFNGANGRHPFGTMVMDSSGNLFGSTTFGGPDDRGTVFEVVAGSNTITSLASFNGTNGANPRGIHLIQDSQGNLFGTASAGGAFNRGTVFEVAAGSSTITTLASFNGTNGAFPWAGVVMDSQGNLFGTTVEGGANNVGTVYKLAAGSNTITTLATFGGPNGTRPFSSLVLDSSGSLFGTTETGGASNVGTLFVVTKTPTTTTALGGTFTYDGTPHAGTGSVDVPGGVVTLSYEGINGTVYSSATAPTNAGTYQVTASYAGDADHSPSSASAVLTIEPKLLEATAASPGKINLRSKGKIVLQVNIAAGQLPDPETIASLFNGATFTIRIQLADGSATSGTLAATANVQGNGTIKIVLPLNRTLRTELRQAYENGRTAAFHLSAHALDGNCLIDELTRPLKVRNTAARPERPLRPGR